MSTSENRTTPDFGAAQAVEQSKPDAVSEHGEIVIRNAQITSTHLGREHHWMRALLGLKHGLGTQCYTAASIEQVRCSALLQLCETVGVESWEELKGKYCRIKLSKGGKAWDSMIVGIGHIVEDNWFSWQTIAEQEAAHE